MFAADRVLAQNPFDHHFLGKLLVVILGAVNMLAEKLRQPEQPGLLLHEHFVRAAGQINGETALAQVLEELARTVHEPFHRFHCPRPQAIGSRPNQCIESMKIFVLVPERFARLAAPFLDTIGQLDHLVDSLLAVKAHDVVRHERAHRFIRFIGAAREHFHEHRDHDFRPALADQ